MEGNKAYSISDYEKAASFFEKAIKENSLLPSSVYLKLGRSYEALHQYEAAIVVYTSMEDRATPPIYLELITELTEKLNRVDEARKVWNKLHQKYPNSPENYIGIYKILLVEGDKNSAIDSLKRGMSLFPHDHFFFYKELCSYFLSMKAYDSIDELYNKTEQKIKCESSYFSFNTDIIDSLFVQKKEDLANILLKRQGELNCLDEFKRYKLFKCFLALGDTNAAFGEGRRLLELKPSDPIYYYSVAELEEKSGNLTQALDIYKQLYDNIGSSIDTKKFLDLFLAVARKYQKEGKYQKAILVLSDVPYKYYYDPRILFTLAKQYYLQNNYDKTKWCAEYSLGQYVRQQEANPMDTNTYVNAGLCYLLMEDLTKAEGEFQKHLNRADKAGKEEAIRRLRELASENINKPDAEYLLKKYYGQTTEIAVHSQSAPTEKPQLVGLMALDSFGTSAKINPESDKAYVLVHSQIPFLRFDSNRKIDQVNQLSSGDWEVWLPAGTHILKISADGFQRLELPPMNFGKKRSYEMTIKVATSTPEQ
ncbi:MAG: tetratricopeptide repeat protein [Bacteroidota bacterium]|jgi:tetratricopeptide (TPR) repeat protein